MVPFADRLIFVKMKARRADEHFQSLERELAKWSAKTHAISEKTDFERAVHVVTITISPTPEIIPMLFGDFVCCLRSSLDQLAWRLAHLPPKRTFSRTQQRQINFPIFEERSSTYNDRRGLFPAAVADIVDTFQPYLRGTAFRDDPLWQLNELWNLDKHRTSSIPPYNISLGYADDFLHRFVRHNRLTYDLEVAIPLFIAWTRKVDLKPTLTVEILFGETNTLELSINRLREINNFVRNEVIPRFTGFFT
jgi:hypothetical protein